MKENTLSNKHPVVQVKSKVFVKWLLDVEKKGQIPMPNNGMLSIHLYVNDKAWKEIMEIEWFSVRNNKILVAIATVYLGKVRGKLNSGSEVICSLFIM